MTQALQAPNGQKQAKELTIKDMVASPVIQEKLKKLASKYITSERLGQALLMEVSRNNTLQECSANSLLNCLMVATQYGWGIGGPRPGMYLVPYGGVATPIPSYYGFQEIARRSPQEWEIEAEVVRDGDDFKCEKGLHPVLVHTPHDDDDAPITHAYAIARSKDGRTKFEVMTIARIEKIRSRSRAAQKGPWVTDYAEMCKKTVVRQVSKYLPASSEMDAAIELSDKVDRGEPITVEPMEPSTPRHSLKAIKAPKQLAPENPPEGQTPQDAPKELTAAPVHPSDEPDGATPQMIADAYVQESSPELLLSRIKALACGQTNQQARLTKAKAAAQVSKPVAEMSTEEVQRIMYQYKLMELLKT